MTNVIGYIIQAITSAFNGILTGLANPIVHFFDDLILVRSDAGAVTGLTTIAYWGLAFLGIGFITSLAMRIFKRV